MQYTECIYTVLFFKKCTTDLQGFSCQKMIRTARFSMGECKIINFRGDTCHPQKFILHEQENMNRSCMIMKLNPHEHNHSFLNHRILTPLEEVVL